MDIIAAMGHPAIWRPWFKDPSTYVAWRAFLAALFGLPMDEEMAAVYRLHTGRQDLPTEESDEATLIVGRRGGKSFHMALVGCYLAAFRDYREHLAPGERATVAVIAADRRQARSILRYSRALLTECPTLARTVERETAEGFDLDNRVTLEIGTASIGAPRGLTYAAVLADEVAFWPSDESVNAAADILDAIRPGMATIPGAKLLLGSSPYSRKGPLWDAFKRDYGKDGAPLVWKAPTRAMNPRVSQAVIDRAYERDPASAAAEYGAEFRSDVEQLLTLETVEAAVDPGIAERAYVPGLTYRAFVDPSGGSSDSMTLAIGHSENGVAMLDAVRERKPPFSPEAVVAEFADLLKSYGLHEVTGDRYAGEWPRERFRVAGIEYKIAEKPRSDLYLALVPLLNSRKVALLDHSRLTSQLVGLERRTSRAGKDVIDHAPGAHDDIANSVAGVIALLDGEAQPLVFSEAFKRRAAQPGPHLRRFARFS